MNRGINIPPQMQAKLQQAMRSMNPASILAQIENNPQLMQNPRIKDVLEMRNNHDTEGLNKMATNIFNENGMNFSEFSNNIKQNMGFN